MSYTLKHYIIVKYNDQVKSRAQLQTAIKACFAPATALQGIYRVSVHSAVLLSEIRYDLMIEIEMAQDALKTFDESDVHKQWKKDFSHLIAHKVIFDCN